VQTLPRAYDFDAALRPEELPIVTLHSSPAARLLYKYFILQSLQRDFQLQAMLLRCSNVAALLPSQDRINHKPT